jgi:tripartite-type tricarboxylate transporter receptor subunit TctC
MAACAAGADYPIKPITLVVPFAAGGPTDKVARDLVEVLRQHLGQQRVVIENVAGAGGTLGAAKVVKAPPDGYTILLHHIGMATSPSMYRQLPYDTLNDFEPLGLVNEVPMTLVGRGDLPATNMAQLLKWIAANQGRANMAHAGLGAASHLCQLMFRQSIQLPLATVAYKGTAPAMNDLLGGQVDLLCDQTTNTSQWIESGRIRAFGVTTPGRLSTSILARLPTLDEAGLKGFSVTIWHGLYAPKGTPVEVLRRLNAAAVAAVHDPGFVRRQEALGAVVVTDARTSREGHRQFVATEMAKWKPVIKAAGQYAD